MVITDLRMPPGFTDEGIEAAAEIRAFASQVGLMLLSQYVEVHHALRLMEEFDGAVGYLLKDRVSDLGAFAVDVRRVATGEVVSRLHVDLHPRSGRSVTYDSWPILVALNGAVTSSTRGA